MSGAGVTVAAYAGLSVSTLALFAWDKGQARRGGARVAERTLLLLTFAGGFPGAWVGRTLLRHKTRKPYFGWGIAAGAVLHGLAWGAWAAWLADAWR